MSLPIEDQNIVDSPFHELLGERYLAYAMSTIMSRSLPDVRDGLKPVHRRLLYAMMQLKLDPTGGFKKCARVVGDVIGKYHPHGDTAVYDAMVRLAQYFAVRYPLVDGQGNFGSIDGDNPAAMRYTEARLTEFAIALLDGINEDTVDFTPTYDGSDDEPVVLPAAYPNLLANGTEGIAVGMATSIPPHNIGELCSGLVALIDKKSTTVEELITNHIAGPDFPTGGVIIEAQQSLIETYSKGKGAIRIRAAWHKEDLGRGNWRIIVTEMPYQVQKSRLIEKIADLYKDKKLPLLGNIQDESAEDIRLVLEPKSKTTPPELLMESLFKLSDLEVRFNLNLNVVTAAGVPQVLDIKSALQQFLDHRLIVLERRSRYRLAKIEHRLEILDGLLIAYLNIDEVIRIIREEDEPKAVMMAKWSLSEVQVEAILNMRLRSLRKLEEFEIRSEHDELSKERDELMELLADEGKMWRKVRSEIKEIGKRFGDKNPIGERRSKFGDAPAEIEVSADAFLPKEPITVLLSKMGWIRAVKGHNQGEDAKYKDGDKEKFRINCYSNDKLLIMASNGKIFTIGADKLATGRGFGDPLRLLADIDADSDICAIIPHVKGQETILATIKGKGFIADADDLLAQTKSGKQVLNVKDGDRAKYIKPITDGDSHIAVVGTHRRLLVFSMAELPKMKKGQGVILQRYQAAELADIISFNSDNGLVWQLGEKTRTEPDITPWLGKRGSSGRVPPKGFPRNNRF